MREVYFEILDSVIQDFPSGSGVKGLPANAGDTGLIPGLEVPTWSRPTRSMRHSEDPAQPKIKTFFKNKFKINKLIN